MNPRRFATLAAAALCRTEVVPVCVLVCLAALGSAGSGTTGARPIIDRVAPSLAANAEIANIPRVTALSNAADGNPEVVIVGRSTSGPTEPTVSEAEPMVEATVAGPAEKEPSETPPVQVAALEPPPVAEAAVSDPAQKPPSDTPPVQVAAIEPQSIVEATVTDSTEKPPSDTPAAPLATASTPSPESSDAPKQTLSSIEIFDECWAVDVCIDRYLWALYQRTPKEDTIRVEERSKVTVKRKGKMVTVTRTSTRVVDEDFAWKDPKAADKAGMTMADYVIGGMDQGFKVKLFHVLRAAENAGLSPGITSAFRDDFRQSIASGLKAANDRSYHGGSFRGGYGHGLAADIVSVNGATRAQRQASSENLWKWIDAHGQEFGIGRPYLDRDPPHVAPIDGTEYANHRGTKPREATAKSEKHKRLVARDERSVAKRPKTAKSS